jgi:hypothetical protein
MAGNHLHVGAGPGPDHRDLERLGRRRAHRPVLSGSGAGERSLDPLFWSRLPARSGPAYREKSALPMRPELRQDWMAAGYGPTMGSAEVVPPPPPGILRVYHFTSAEFAKDDIVHGRLKVARISDLNDPFEFLSLNFRQISTRHIIDHFKNEYDKHTGLLCFNQNWTSPVLWSHYACRHRGLCLGFNIMAELAKKVNYIEKRAMISVGPTTPSHQVLEKLTEFVLRTKYNRWSYEEEFRYFVPLTDTIEDAARKLHFYPFGDALTLTEVILGPFCDISLADARQLVKDHCPNPVATFPTRLATQWFAVVPHERFVL